MARKTKLQANLDILLRTPQGILRIVDEKWSEKDCLDFKRTINRNDPKWEHALLGDCAALATTGVGFLLIGIDESRDKTDRAAAIAPVIDPFDLKNAIEDRLSRGFSPPLRRWEVWVVETDRGAVVVVRVEGRRGYPIEVEALRDAPRHFLRIGAKNQRINSENARLQRHDFELRDKRKLLLIGAALPLTALVILSLLYYRNRVLEEAAKEYVVDPRLCGYYFHQGALLSPDSDLGSIHLNAETAFMRRSPTECWSLHARLIKTFPEHVWRHWLAGQCFSLEGNKPRAQEQFKKSANLAGLAYERNRSCGDFGLLQALSIYSAGLQDEGCESLKALATSNPGGASQEHPTIGHPCPASRFHAQG